MKGSNAIIYVDRISREMKSKLDVKMDLEGDEW